MHSHACVRVLGQRGRVNLVVASVEHTLPDLGTPIIGHVNVFNHCEAKGGTHGLLIPTEIGGGTVDGHHVGGAHGIDIPVHEEDGHRFHLCQGKRKAKEKNEGRGNTPKEIDATSAR